MPAEERPLMVQLGFLLSGPSQILCHILLLKLSGDRKLQERFSPKGDRIRIKEIMTE